MTKAKHTPGPWRVDRRASTRVVSGHDDTVATCACQSDLVGSFEANARLIAAAPDMLEALQAFVREPQPTEAWLAMTGLDRQMFTAAHAAIAKATGEQ